MRILRSTMYGPDLSPLTTVVRDNDVRDTLDSIRLGARQPGYYLATEIFEVSEDVGIETATTEAMGRWQAAFDEERNMAIQFYWATQQFQLLQDRGTLIMPAPAPFPTAKVCDVFEQIAEHPDYTRQTVMATSCEGEIVTLENGKVTW